ncbi:hypothetical protein [Luteimonas sp. MC1572]|uniref:hypothetical protein n=1 Tax=Luteimonas sp. MC1572 TaxID=2799325 RepID=UPI0018F09A93|nr:hypothetical protein [Luteimonas sp. MC1572]MBJ6981278.1 hypothetical protein [Luteimonas sp. MC1572]QQO02601.1 hypothetical protein JGR64_10490 [Luteimonas sp. MC1572]
MSIPLNPLVAAMALALALAGCDRAVPPDTPATAPEATAPTAVATAPAPMPESGAVAAPQLHAAMRELWHGHIVHARDYALAVHAGGTADAQAAADAVVENATQISTAVAGFYGEAGGKQMLALLGGHWGAVKALTDARAAGGGAAAEAAMADLTANAGEIAKFLAGANPNLPEDTVHGLMLAHGAHHSRQVDLILADDTAGEAAEWSAMQTHMDMIADALAGAIAKQFPDKAT